MIRHTSDIALKKLHILEDGMVDPLKDICSTVFRNDSV